MPKRGAGWIRVTHPCAGRLPKQTPRLACVKPVASVHPEPGSNSSLYNLIFVCFSRKLVVCLMLTGFNRIKAGKYYSCLLYQELVDGSYLFLYFIYTTIFFLASRGKSNRRPLYCYVCMECFQGSYASSRWLSVCVPCRKRVQRYGKILNYQTFCKENFERKLQSMHKLHNISSLDQYKSY